MKNEDSRKPESVSSDAASRPSEETPVRRTYTPAEQLIFGVKLAAIVGLIVLVLWALDRYL